MVEESRNDRNVRFAVGFWSVMRDRKWERMKEIDESLSWEFYVGFLLSCFSLVFCVNLCPLWCGLHWLIESSGSSGGKRSWEKGRENVKEGVRMMVMGCCNIFFFSF